MLETALESLSDSFDKNLTEHEKANDGALYAMSESLMELSDKTEDAINEINEKLKAFEEEDDSEGANRKIEKAFLEGFSNIMNYEVSYGRGKQAQ